MKNTVYWTHDKKTIHIIYETGKVKMPQQSILTNQNYTKFSNRSKKYLGKIVPYNWLLVIPSEVKKYKFQKMWPIYIIKMLWNITTFHQQVWNTIQSEAQIHQICIILLHTFLMLILGTKK